MEPMPSISTPSYSSWAAFMVRRAWKPSFRLASCCKVEVINGGAGERFFLPFFTAETRNSSFSKSANSWSDSSLELILISPFSSP